MTMIEFYECANYSGPLQAQKEGDKFFWRVDCDVNLQEWLEIPAYLGEALFRYHAETAEERKP
jgi:hypothetical protein